jgi:hypothetical protein
MIPREISPKILHYARHYPVVTITGPRQSGKTTLCRHLFPDWPYVNLENLEERSFAASDPKGFLNRFPRGCVLDEIQRAPELLSYIQVDVDEKNEPGCYILTGSQNFTLMDSINQSLAGRTALARLLPFSVRESRTDAVRDLDDVLFQGGYPRIHAQGLEPTEWLSFYVSTYLERDIRSLVNIKDLTLFETFLKLVAGRVGQLINLSSLGNDCGVNYNTIKNWLSLLEASFIIKRLPPYYENFRKRIVKSHKLYFYDTGLACYLMGIHTKEQLMTHPLRGQLFENFIVSELLKNRFNQGKPDNLYFFRDNTGNEVDVVLDQGTELTALEIKSAQTINTSFFKGITYFSKLSGKVGRSILVYGGGDRRIQNNVQIVGWEGVAELA